MARLRRLMKEPFGDIRGRMVSTVSKILTFIQIWEPWAEKSAEGGASEGDVLDARGVDLGEDDLANVLDQVRLKEG